MASKLIWRRVAVYGHDIARLLSDACDGPLAIVVSNYISKSHADHLYNQFCNHPRRESYALDTYSSKTITKPIMTMYGVDRIGPGYNITFGKEPDSIEVQKFYDAIPEHIADMARRCAPYDNPILKFIEEMNSGSNRYPFGMQIAAFDNRLMYAGIIRIMEPSIEGSELISERPHIDRLPDAKCSLIKQLTCNIYFKVPADTAKAGGDLEIWDVRKLPFQTDTNTLNRNDAKHFLKTNGAIPITYTPQLGDLIIFNARMPHSVKTLTQDVRMTLQTFIGYQGPGKPLVCWN